MNEIIMFLQTTGSKLIFPILTGYLFFKLVEYFTSKIKINNYIYDDISNEDANILKIVWYTAKEDKNNKKDYTYRFKINNKYLIFINRHDLQLLDRFKLINWLIKEYFLNKICNCRNKILPTFLITTYIEPEFIKLSYNLEQSKKNNQLLVTGVNH